MTSADALRAIICIAVVLFLMRPITGLVVDLFKVMLRMSLTGLVLLVIHVGFIDAWSRSAAGAAHVSAVYVPLICLIALVVLSTTNLIFLTGSSLEGILRIIFYIVGGVFTAGSVAWIAWDESVTSVVVGIVGIFTHSVAIISGVVG